MSTYNISGRYQVQTTGTTTDATVTTVGNFTMPDESTAYVTAYVIARSAGANSAAYRIEAAIHRETGTVSQVTGSPIAEKTFEDTAAPSWAAMDATIDTSGNDFRVRVTGLAATTITWQTTIDMILYVA